METVKHVGFDSAFTFVYSPRAGTEAAAMPNQIPADVKRDRIERLVEQVQRVASARNADRIGRIEEVLVEGPSRTDPSLLRGRTRRNTTVNFTGTASPGDFVAAHIDAATSTTLRGVQEAPVTA
jgi:tRNA-2-methylthio-N6-dimethylallyladenosine synthase